MKSTRAAVAWNEFLNRGNNFNSSDPLQSGGAVARVHGFCLKGGSLLYSQPCPTPRTLLSNGGGSLQKLSALIVHKMILVGKDVRCHP